MTRIEAISVEIDTLRSVIAVLERNQMAFDVDSHTEFALCEYSRDVVSDLEARIAILNAERRRLVSSAVSRALVNAGLVAQP